jgi:ribose transport system ATP-binding protein
VSALLEVQGLVKSFHGNRVVDDVSFTLAAGQIVALLGENGAGKSTLIKMLAGVYKRDGGHIRLEGRHLEEPGVRGRISFIHQDLGLVDWMTVGENMALSLGFPRRGGGSRGLVDWAAVEAQAAKALGLVGGGIDPSTRMFDLPRTEKALVAIARALVTKPALLVLDEPTASLPAADVQRLFAVLRDLVASGVGMIYVSHRLDEVYDIADSVVVMRNGVKVGDAPVEQVPPQQLVALIVGHDTQSVTPGEVGSQVRLGLDGLVAGDVGPVDLTVRRGEVVGLVGLRGAGQTEVGRAIAGATRVTGGRMRLDGARFAPRSTTDAVTDGVGFATSNRETEGVAAGLSVRENLFLNPGVWGRTLRSLSTQRAERVRARELVARFGVRPADTEVAADTLSGGNQQRSSSPGGSASAARSSSSRSRRWASTSARRPTSTRCCVRPASRAPRRSSSPPTSRR